MSHSNPLYRIVPDPEGPPVTKEQMDAYNAAAFRHWQYGERTIRQMRRERSAEKDYGI